MSDDARTVYQVVSAIEGFKYDRQARALVCSYETFRLHKHRLDDVSFDLVICDEAHRLKNDRTKMNQCIADMATPRRLLISGTPIQNDLDEFYTLVSLANPQVLGTSSDFRRDYVRPILDGRDPTASVKQKSFAEVKLNELSNLTKLFIIRRSNALLSKVLPVKVILNTFCGLSAVQRELYESMLQTNTAGKAMKSNGVDSQGKPTGGKALMLLQCLNKICSHPSLLLQSKLAGFEQTRQKLTLLYPDGYNPSSLYQPDCAGKMLFLSKLLQAVRSLTDDRVVIISNYTKTMDLIQMYCKSVKYPVKRLDGGVSLKLRHKMVCDFNDFRSANNFIFLLSSKAGGCGINLIGANRLVMFDPDWNPANDQQALARIWRDGQAKTCYIYRLFTVGTVEERIFQRQVSKSGLGTMVVTCAGDDQGIIESHDDHDDIFKLTESSTCSTHDNLLCKRCDDTGCDQMSNPLFNKEDIRTWSHMGPPYSRCLDELLPEVAVQGSVKFIMQAKIIYEEDQAVPTSEATPGTSLINRGGDSGIERTDGLGVDVLKSDEESEYEYYYSDATNQ